MDFLRKAGNFLGNAAYQGAKFLPGVGNVIRSYEQASKNTNLARQQAANRYQQQNRPVPQQLRQAPQPRLNYNAAMSALNALKAPNLRQGAENVSMAIVNATPLKAIVDPISRINQLQTRNPEIARQVAQKTQNIQNRIAQVPRLNLQPKTGNGIADFALGIPAGIANSFVNAPANISQGSVNYADALLSQGRQQKVGLRGAVKSIAQAELPILDVASNFAGAGVVKNIAQQGAKQGFKQAVKESAKTGFKEAGKYGLAHGFLGSLADSAQTQTREEFVKNALMQSGQEGMVGGVTGGIFGGLLGGGLNGLSNLTGKLRAAPVVTNTDASGLIQRPGSKVRIDLKTGKKVFAPQYNPGGKATDSGLQADNYNRNFAGKFSKKQASSEGSTRVISERELNYFNKNGELPANPEGYTNIIKPGEIDNIKGITDSKKYLVKLRDGVKIDSESGPQYAVKGGIDGKYVAEIAPYVKSADRVPVLSKKFNDSMYADGAIGNDYKGPIKQDPLEVLKAEARKYKSADEFVKAKQSTQKDLNVHDFLASHLGGSNPLTDPSKSNSLRTLTVNGKSIDYQISKHTDSQIHMRMLYAKDPGSGLGSKFMNSLKEYSDQTGKPIAISSVQNPGFFDKFKWLKGESGTQTYRYDPKSQLTDLYNQATKPKVRLKGDDSLYTPGAIGNDIPNSVAAQLDAAPKVSGLKGKQRLNTTRLALDSSQQADIASRQSGLTDTLTDKEVQQIAKGSGLDLKSHTIEQTRDKIAKQLNVRSEIVTLEKKATELSKNGGNPVEIGDLYKQIDELARTSSAQGTDIARQLSARRIIADETKTPMQRVFILLNKEGVNPDVYTQKAVGVDFSNANEATRFYRSLVPAKAGDYLDLVRYNSMLSSPLTQVVNVSSTAGNIALAPIERGIASNLDFVRSLATGKPRKFASGEGTEYAVGMAKSWKDAVGAFKNTMSGLDDNINIETGSNTRIPIAAKGDNKTVSVLEFPMKLMGAFDNFNRTLVAGGSNRALKLRADSGIRVRNPEAAGAAEGAYRTFNQEIGDKSQGNVLRAIDEVTNLVMKARGSKNKVLSVPAKWTLPFVRIGANLMKQGIEYSPAGVITIPGAVDKTSQLAKSMMGTAVFGTAAGLLGKDRLTWATPTDEKGKQAFQAAGMQPYSMKIGDKWIGYSKLPPIISFNMAFVSALDDAQKNSKIDQNDLDNILTAVSKFGNFLSDQSYLKSVGDLLSAVKGDPEAVTKLVSNYPQQLVPLRALSGWVARMTDTKQRKVNYDASYWDQQVESLFQQIPGLRQNTNTRNDQAGNPIPAQNPVLNAFSPLPVSTENPTGKIAFNMLQQKRKDDATEKFQLDRLKEAYKSGDTSVIGGLSKQQKSSLDKSIKEDAIKKTLNPIETQLWAYTQDELKGMSDPAAQKVLGLKKTLSSSSTPSNPKERYQAALDTYTQDKADGKISDITSMSKSAALDRLRVQADFDQNTVDLYSQSKANIDKYLKGQPNGGDLFKQIVALDDALVASGHKTKLRNSKGAISITPKIKLSKAAGGKRAKTRQPKFTSTRSRGISRVRAKGAPKIKFASAPKRGKTAKIKIA